MIQDLHSFGYYNHTMHACSKPVNFTGMSQGSQYRTSFDFIAAKMINNNTKKWQLDGSWLSAANISKAMEKLFMLNKVFGPYKEANPLKIAWKNYNDLKFLQCACRFTENLHLSEEEISPSARLNMKNLIKTLKTQIPEVENHIFKSIHNCQVDTLVGYKSHGKQYDFDEIFESNKPKK